MSPTRGGGALRRSALITKDQYYKYMLCMQQQPFSLLLRPLGEIYQQKCERFIGRPSCATLFVRTTKEAQRERESYIIFYFLSRAAAAAALHIEEKSAIALFYDCFSLSPLQLVKSHQNGFVRAVR